jgi:hypothetical protein
MMIGLLCLTWGMVGLFFVLLVRIGAKLVPTPPSIERNSGSALGMKASRLPLHTGSTFVLNPRLSNSR